MNHNLFSGKFRTPGQKSQTHAQTIADMHDSFALEESAIEVVPSTEAGKASVISDEMLGSLLDRSWDDGDIKKVAKARKGKATFAVFDSAAETEGGNHLAKLFGEDIQ